CFGTNGLLRGSSAIRKFRSAAFADAPKDQWREPPPLPLLQGHRRPRAKRSSRGSPGSAYPGYPSRSRVALVQRLRIGAPIYPSPPITLRFGLRRPLAPPHGRPKRVAFLTGQAPPSDGGR